MEVKKSPKASLENKRLLFTEIGLVVALGIVYGAFEWSSKDKAVALLEDTTQVLVEEEMIAIQNELPPPPPEAPQIPVLSDQIDIVDAVSLKSQHDLHKLVFGNRPPDPSERDFVILAVYAAQAAPAEKDGAGAVLSADRRLLPEMRSGSRNPYFRGFSAISCTLFSVRTAVPRTSAAWIHRRLLSLYLHPGRKYVTIRLSVIFGGDL